MPNVNPQNIEVNFIEPNQTALNSENIDNLVLSSVAIKNNVVEIDPGTSYTIDGFFANSTLNFTNIMGSHDIFKYNSNFSYFLDLFDNSANDFEIKHAFNKTTLKGENLIFDQRSTAIIDRSINGTEILEIEVTISNLEIKPSKMAWLSLNLDTDEYWASIIFAATQNYESFSTNATGSVKFFRSQSSIIRLNLSEIAEFANTDIPSLLKSIEFQSYGNDNYNISLELTRLSLVETLHSISRESKSMVSQNSLISIPSKQNLTVYADLDSSYEISYLHTFQSFINLSGNVEVQNKSLYYIGNTNFSNIIVGFNYTILLKKYLVDYIIESVDYIHENGTLVLFDVKSNNSLSISGQLIKSPNIELQFQKFIQGQNIKIANPFNLPSNAFIHHIASNEDFILSLNNNSFDGIIPFWWSKGEIEIYFWSNNGSYTSYNQELELSPSRLKSSKTYQLNQAKTEILPIYLENITSGEIFIPNKIQSYINESLWKIDGERGLVIEAGSLNIGIHDLMINATSNLFVPVVFSIQLIVGSINDKMDISIERTSINSATLKVDIEEWNNWTVESSYNILTGNNEFNGSINSSRFVIQFRNVDWLLNQSYEITLKITIDKIATLTKIIKIDQFISLKDKDIPLRGFFIGSLTSILIGTASYSIKKYKNRPYSQSIEF